MGINNTEQALLHRKTVAKLKTNRLLAQMREWQIKTEQELREYEETQDRLAKARLRAKNLF